MTKKPSQKDMIFSYHIALYSVLEYLERKKFKFPGKFPKDSLIMFYSAGRHDHIKALLDGLSQELETDRQRPQLLTPERRKEMVDMLAQGELDLAIDNNDVESALLTYYWTEIDAMSDEVLQREYDECMENELAEG